MSLVGSLRAALPGVVALVLAACTSAAPAPPTATRSSAAAPDTLKGVCPDTIVLQSNWWPEPDHGIWFQLIGPNGTVDTNRNIYSGPLGSTGVNVEIRAGGPAVAFQPVIARMYSDDSILLGMVGTDDQIGSSATQPTKAVLAWYARNPQVFFWGNPAWSFSSVADIGRSGATVLAFEASAYVQVMVGKGLLNRSQLDTSYTGDPSRFVAADGNIVSQGFVTAEPYIYEHEVNGWKKPVKFLLLDPEVPIYQNTIVVRADKVDANRACLERLIPLMQRSSIDYLKNPGAVNNVLIDYTSRMRGGTPITAAGAADAVQKMGALGIVANGADGVFGSYDLARVRNLIDDYGPVFAARGKTPRPGLQPSDLVTNEFLDPSIKL